MSGLIPQACIDEVLQRTDLLELIDAYIPLKKHGRNYLACCPFHQEKTPSFNVVPKKQFYYCFGCGASGNAISFLMQYLNQSFVEAVEHLATRLGIMVQTEAKTAHKKIEQSLYDLLSEVNHFFQKNLVQTANEGQDYLQKRGLSQKTIKQYQLGYAPPGWHNLEQAFKGSKKDLITTGMLIENEDKKIYDRYRERITFPIHDRYGKIVGFGGRAIKDTDKPKYLNSPETPLFQKNRELYGLYQALQHQETPEQLIVVEGYMDVLALAEHGIWQACATLGTATSSMHIQLLNKYANQIIFCFDGDDAGQKAAWRALEQSISLLDSKLDLRFMFLPKEHDPDSLIRSEGRAAFLALVDKAIPFVRYFLQGLGQNIVIGSAIGKSQLLDKAKPYFNNMPDCSYKAFLIEELGRLTHLDAKRIESLFRGKEKIPEPKKAKPIGRSPVRLAIALLLQDPSLYTKINPELSQNLANCKEYALLAKILEYIAVNPKMNTGHLLEYWRGQKEFEPLSQLASWDHFIPEENRASELVDIIQFLQKQAVDNQVNQLIEKSRHNPLTEAERNHLQLLLKQRHQKDKSASIF